MINSCRWAAFRNIRALSVLAVVLGLRCCFPSLSILESFALISFSNSWINYGPPHPTPPQPTFNRFDQWLLSWYLDSASNLSSLCINLLFVTKLGFYFSELDLGLPFLVCSQSWQLLKTLNHFMVKLGIFLSTFFPFSILHFHPNPHPLILVSVSVFVFCWSEVLVGLFIAIRSFCHRKHYFKLTLKIYLVNVIH